MGLAREALVGLAEVLALSREQYDDIRTAVTEACNNVVQHAYGDKVGPLELEVCLLDDALDVAVRDHGVGMTRAAEQVSELEIGLPVMLTLCERLQVGHPGEGGTEVQMLFNVPGLNAATTGCARAQLELDLLSDQTRSAIHSSFSSVELACAVLPRLATALAVRAHFTADRVSDVQLLCDTIARAAFVLAYKGCLGVGLEFQPRRLELQVGPLVSSGADRLLDAGKLQLIDDAVGSSTHSLSIIERLAQERSTILNGEQQTLVLGLLDFTS